MAGCEGLGWSKQPGREEAASRFMTKATLQAAQGLGCLVCELYVEFVWIFSFSVSSSSGKTWLCLILWGFIVVLFALSYRGLVLLSICRSRVSSVYVDLSEEKAQCEIVVVVVFYCRSAGEQHAPEAPRGSVLQKEGTLGLLDLHRDHSHTGYSRFW